MHWKKQNINDNLQEKEQAALENIWEEDSDAQNQKQILE